MDIRDKIQYVLDSDISGYRLDKDFNIPQSVVSSLRLGDTSLGRIELITAEKFLKAYDYLKEHNK